MKKEANQIVVYIIDKFSVACYTFYGGDLQGSRIVDKAHIFRFSTARFWWDER